MGEGVATRDLLGRTAATLAGAGVPSPHADAELLLGTHADPADGVLAGWESRIYRLG